MTKNNRPTKDKRHPVAGQEPIKNLSEPKLTKKQQMFVQEYLVDLNATQAAIRAGYSEHSATAIGMENLTKPYLKAAIDLAIKERSERTGITADQVIRELASIGLSDMKDFVMVNNDGSVQAIPLDGLESGRSRIIKKIKEKRIIKSTAEGDAILESTFEFELCDKVKSLELLSRHLGLLHDKSEIDVNQTVNVTIDTFCDD